MSNSENGRSERIRTSDPHNPIVVRYQAAPRSDRYELLPGLIWHFTAKAALMGC